MGIPNIIVRLQKLIIESLETQRNNSIGSNPKIPSLQQLKTQLIDEFGAPMYHGYLASFQLMALHNVFQLIVSFDSIISSSFARSVNRSNLNF